VGSDASEDCSNPVSVLFNENVLYQLTAVNATATAKTVVVVDTLPPYMKYVSGFLGDTRDTVGTPPRIRVRWVLPNEPPTTPRIIGYETTPESGACASQPMYINKAWIGIVRSVGDTLWTPTNSTYHQGAGIAVITFSATAGGKLFYAYSQALDYRTTPRAGVTAVPEEGFEFAGWSHEAYFSLRGELIPADSGIPDYKNIVIHGDVDLRANFVPISVKPVEIKISPEPEPLPDTNNKVWVSDNTLYICTKSGTIARFYTLDGILRRQFSIEKDGVTTTPIERGTFIVTLDGVGWKVVAR
jgi:uncharacterized repeat protein (TIGR01451 family)